MPEVGQCDCQWAGLSFSFFSMWESTLTVLNGYAGIIVAGCAMILTIANMWMMRKHQERATRPLLVIQGERHSGGDVFSYKLTVRNRGLGPALIKRVECEFDGEFVNVEELARERIARALPANATTYPLDKGDALSPGDQRLIFSVSTKADLRDLNREELNRRLRNFKVEVVYESLYGWRKKFTFKAEQPVHTKEKVEGVTRKPF